MITRNMHLLEMLIVAELIKLFPAFCWTGMLITTFTREYAWPRPKSGAVPIFHLFTAHIMSRVSAVDVATSSGLDDRGRGRSTSPYRVKNFLFSMLFRPALGPIQSPMHWVTGALSSGVKWPGREADHSPPTSAEVKKIWIYTYTLPRAFMT
jgi:hypothetical protein